MKKFVNLQKSNFSTCVVSLCLFLTGCVVTPLGDVQKQNPVTATQESNTQVQPDRIYLETPESKAVIVGSQLQASLNGCTNMQRYRIRTNTDFLSTLNLFKYRAALMGAKRIVVINHTEIDSKEFFAYSDRNQVFLREGTTLQGSYLFTALTADLYDCSK